MGTALIKIKLMPTSPEINLEEIKEKAKQIVEEKQGKRPSFTEEPIAFGLKAVILFFELDESLELDPLEEALRKVENVNSAEMIDMRRMIE